MMRPTIRVPLVGALAVIAYAAFAAVQILVLNPLAAAPGLSLAEIDTALGAANESIGRGWVLGFLGFGVALAVVAAVLCIVRRTDVRLSAAVFLGLLALGAPAYFVASFGPGMALADTFYISGADASPWGLALYIVSFLAVLALVPVIVWRSRPAAPAAPERARTSPTL